MEFLSDRLMTPLQINYYLSQAIEKAYLTGTSPIDLEIIQSILSPDIDGLEAKLSRNGYGIGTLCEVLSAKPKEVKSYLNGLLPPSRAQEFNCEIHKLGVI